MTDEPPLPDEDAPEAPTPSAPAADASTAAETRWSIVGRQFRKHRPAVWGLRVTLALIVLAIYAPVLASGHPFAYRTPDGTWSFPWFTNLFDTRAWDQPIDRLFNLAMVVVTIYFLGRLLLDLLNVDSRRLWRRFAIFSFVVVGILQLAGIGVTSGETIGYRKPINDVKHAEDVVDVVPVVNQYRTDLAAAGTSFGKIQSATKTIVDGLADLKSTSAARFVPPVERAWQAYLAERTKIDFAVRRIGKKYKLPFGAVEPVPPGSDATGPSDALLASWMTLRTVLERPAGNELPADPQPIVARATEQLSGDPDPTSTRYAVDLARLDANLQRFVDETNIQLTRDLDQIDVPTVEEADDAVRAAKAARAEYVIIYPPIPYSYRDQLPQGYDRFRRTMDFERGEIHLLGTDEEGRDVFSRLLYGTRISLTIGLVAVSIYITIGTILGALAGFFGGFVDLLIMRLVEIMICIPGLFLILTIVALFDQKSIFMIMFAIGIVSWTGITRLVRGEFLRERNAEYVLSARSMGFSTPRIIFRHVLPNAIGPVLVAATFGVAGAILTESGLSFLGLGDTTAPSWGGILDHGRTNQMWHLIVPPSIAIFITVTALNLVGDGVRDALDPKLRD